MGGGIKKDKKFIKKIYGQIKQGKNQLFVVDDKFGTPTYTKDFSEAMLKIIPTGYYGLYNQVCNGGGNRLDVAREFIALLGLSKEVKIVSVKSDFFGKEYSAPRPYSEKLVNFKLNNRDLNFMRDWKESLRDYTQEFREDYYKKDN